MDRIHIKEIEITELGNRLDEKFRHRDKQEVHEREPKTVSRVSSLYD